jgi:hypothetical protein
MVDYSGMMGADSSGMAGLFALGMTVFFILLVVFLVVYIYQAIALMAIAKKTKTKNGWLAFIPIANVYLITQMAGVSGWFTLGIFLAWIPLVGGLALGVLMIWMFWQVAEKIKFPGWTSILMIIPLVNLIVLGMWAWSKK